MTSLYDWMADNGYMDSGCDCYDGKFSYPQLCIIPVEEEEDPYDRAVNWILKNVEFIAAGREPAYGLVGDFEKFAKEHFQQFVVFTQGNKEDFIMNGDMDDDDNIFKAMATIHTLCAGGYSDESYERFLQIMGASA